MNTTQEQPSRQAMIDYVANRYSGLGSWSSEFRARLTGLDDSKLHDRYRIEVRRSEDAKMIGLAFKAYRALQGVLEEHYTGLYIWINPKTGNFRIGTRNIDLREFVKTLPPDSGGLYCGKIGSFFD